MTTLSSLSVLIALVVFVVVPHCCVASLDINRVWLVDHGPVNYLFRGNMPTNDTDSSKPVFAYDTLLSYMRTKAAQAGVTLPDDLYLIDISLNNPFDGPDFWAEEAFWKDGAHADLGKFINWPLGLAGVVPPSVYPPAKRMEMANSSVWAIDKIPSRIEIIHNMLATKFDKPAVIYVHCSAGCDRTGEVIGSYRLWYNSPNVTKMYMEDTTECGRSPNYFSTGALEWFCLYCKDRNHGIGDQSCLDFASCKLFGKCHPTGDNLTAAQTATSGPQPPSSPFHSLLELGARQADLQDAGSSNTGPSAAAVAAATQRIARLVGMQ